MFRLLGILTLLAVVGYIVLKDIISNIKIKPDLKGLDLSGSLKSIFEGKGVLKTDIRIEIYNGKRFTIPISDLFIEIYHDGNLIATSQEIDKKVNLISKQTTTEISHKIDVNLTKSFFDTIEELKEGEEITLNYKIKGRLFKIPRDLTIEKSFELIKK